MANLPSEQDIEEFSPYRLLRNFSRNRVLPCFLAAVVLHVLVIGGLSYEFIYTTWIDPSTGSDQATGVEGEGAAEDEPAGDDAANSATTDAAAKEGSDDAGDRTSDDDELNSPVVREITEKAQPDEIPDKPDDFGISIDDTNP